MLLQAPSLDRSLDEALRELGAQIAKREAYVQEKQARIHCYVRAVATF